MANIITLWQIRFDLRLYEQNYFWLILTATTEKITLLQTVTNTILIHKISVYMSAVLFALL